MKYRFYVPRDLTLVQQITWSMVAEVYPCMGIDKPVLPSSIGIAGFWNYINGTTVELEQSRLTRGLFGAN